MGKTTLFPASRELFDLARAMADRAASDHHMTDIEIGRLVGFESARTSRWKHGQIEVSDAARLTALSQALDIDLTTLCQVAAGYLSAEEAMEIVGNAGKLVRFLTEQVTLSADDQALTIASDDGTQGRIVRRRAGHYQRSARRVGSGGATGSDEEPSALLADDDETTIGFFRNLTAEDSGLKGFVARTGPEALVIAGYARPRLVIIDLFLGHVDGFGAVRCLATHPTTRECDIVATSRSLTPEIERQALGCGAREVVQRPLNARTLGRLLTRVRRRG